MDAHAPRAEGAMRVDAARRRREERRGAPCDTIMRPKESEKILVRIQRRAVSLSG